jgi:hypothetical protein
MFQHLPLQDPKKFTQIGIFGSVGFWLSSGNPGACSQIKGKFLGASSIKYYVIRNCDLGKADIIDLCQTSNSQGCQMVYFQTKNPNLGKIWRVFEW